MKIQRKFLYFADAADDTYMFAADNFVEIKNASSTTLNMHFHPGVVGGGTDPTDIITLTIVDGSEKVVCQAIADAIADAYSNAMVVVCDLENSVYLNANITSVALTAAS